MNPLNRRSSSVLENRVAQLEAQVQTLNANSSASGVTVQQGTAGTPITDVRVLRFLAGLVNSSGPDQIDYTPLANLPYATAQASGADTTTNMVGAGDIVLPHSGNFIGGNAVGQFSATPNGIITDYTGDVLMVAIGIYRHTAGAGANMFNTRLRRSTDAGTTFQKFGVPWPSFMNLNLDITRAGYLCFMHSNCVPNEEFTAFKNQLQGSGTVVPSSDNRLIAIQLQVS